MQRWKDGEVHTSHEMDGLAPAWRTGCLFEFQIFGKNSHPKLEVTNLAQDQLEYVIKCVEYDKSH